MLMNENEASAYDAQGNAKHYDNGRINVMPMLEQIYGTLGCMYFCEMNAFKYRMRLGRKQGATVDADLVKCKWYEDAAKFYLDKLKAGEAVPGVDDSNVVQPSTGKVEAKVNSHGLPWKEQK